MDAVRYFDAECARGKRFENPAGLLVSLIRKAMPPEEAPPARNRGKKVPAREKSSSMPLFSHTDDRERAEIEYNKYLNDLGRKAFEALSASERKRLLAQAEAELRSGPHASKYSRMPAEKFSEHLRNLVEIKLSRKQLLPFEEWYNEWKKRTGSNEFCG